MSIARPLLKYGRLKITSNFITRITSYVFALFANVGLLRGQKTHPQIWGTTEMEVKEIDEFQPITPKR